MLGRKQPSSLFPLRGSETVALVGLPGNPGSGTPDVGGGEEVGKRAGAWGWGGAGGGGEGGKVSWSLARSLVGQGRGREPRWLPR